MFSVDVFSSVGVQCYFVHGRCVPKWKVLDVPFLGRCVVPLIMRPCTDKKEYQIFLIYKEIQSGVVARKGFLIYDEMRKYFPIYEEAVSHIWLCNCSTLNFLINEENFILFFISVGRRIPWTMQSTSMRSWIGKHRSWMRRLRDTSSKVLSVQRLFIWGHIGGGPYYVIPLSMLTCLFPFTA